MTRIARERCAAVVFSLLYLLVFSVAWVFFGPPTTLPALATLVAVVLLFGFYTMQRIRRDLRDNSAQLQSVLDVRATLPADVSLPPFGSPAIEADCANVIVRHVLQHRPGLIVEAGSGTSTLLAAACLRQIGSGRVVALEHLLQFAERVSENLALRGLADYGAVRYAPLESQTCDGREWEWFAVASQKFDRPIDLLFVDGPPAGKPERQARFPALPLLREQLNDEAWVIVDDSYRRGERLMLERWKALFADWDYEQRVLPTKRGTGLIRLRRRK